MAELFTKVLGAMFLHAPFLLFVHNILPNFQFQVYCIGKLFYQVMKIILVKNPDSDANMEFPIGSDNSLIMHFRQKFSIQAILEIIVKEFNLNSIFLSSY